MTFNSENYSNELQVLNIFIPQTYIDGGIFC